MWFGCWEPNQGPMQKHRMLLSDLYCVEKFCAFVHQGTWHAVFFVCVFLSSLGISVIMASENILDHVSVRPEEPYARDVPLT